MKTDKNIKNSRIKTSDTLWGIFEDEHFISFYNHLTKPHNIISIEMRIDALIKEKEVIQMNYSMYKYLLKDSTLPLWFYKEQCKTLEYNVSLNLNNLNETINNLIDEVIVLKYSIVKEWSPTLKVEIIQNVLASIQNEIFLREMQKSEVEEFLELDQELILKRPPIEEWQVDASIKLLEYRANRQISELDEKIENLKKKIIFWNERITMISY